MIYIFCSVTSLLKSNRHIVHEEISFLTIYFMSSCALTLKFVNNENYSNYFAIFKCD